MSKETKNLESEEILEGMDDLEIYDYDAVKKLREKRKEGEEEKLSFGKRLKKQYTTKKFKKGAYSSLLIVGILVAVILVNLLVGELDWSKDFSSQGMYTLTEQTQEIVKQVGDNVTIYYISEGGNEIDVMKKIVDKYSKLSDNVTVEYKDPVIYPTFASKYAGVGETVTDNSIVVVNETTGAYKYIPYDTMIEYDYSNYYYGYSSSPELTAIDVEGQITSAISYVTKEDMVKLYQVVDHGEEELSAYLTNEFEKLGTKIENLNTRTADLIPEDCDILLMNGPVTDYTKEEVELVKEYLKTGGKVVVTLNYQAGELSNFNSLLSYYGVKVNQGIVLEASGYYSGEPYYTFPYVKSSDLTDGVSSTINPVFMPFNVALTEIDTRSTVTKEPFLESSEDAYCKLGEEFTTLTQEDSDLEGPFYQGLMVKESYEEVEGTMVIFSSNYIFLEDFVKLSNYGNSTISNNVISYLGGNETGLSIPKKSMEETYIVTTNADVATWTIILVVVLPIAIFSSGIIVWYRRRRG